VDVFIDSPFPVIFVDQRSDLHILARRWKRRSAVYRGVLFARSDSGIDSVEALRGRMVAFGAPYSTSSFLLPKAELGIMGFELDPYQDAAASVPSGRIGYLFSDDAETTMFWVLKNKVAAGSVNRDYYQELAGIRAEELKIVHVTRELPRNLVAVRGDLEPEIGHLLLEVLLTLDRSAEGRQVLAAFEETVRFDELPGGPEGVRLEMAELIPHVEEDLGQ
jgi:phosphonate transport system substrate-binding protein